MSATSIDASPSARLAELGGRVLGGGEVTLEEGRWLFSLEGRAEIFDLLGWANRLREHFKGNHIHFMLNRQREGRRVLGGLPLLCSISRL